MPKLRQPTHFLRLRMGWVALFFAALTYLGTPCANAQSISRVRTVVVDAGHGGHDRGGIPGQKVSEKQVALDTSIRLQRELVRRGYRVIMTRTTDVFIPLSQRVAIANRNRRDTIFVSVHYNSARRVGAMGYETFYYSSGSQALAIAIQRQIMRVARTEDRGVKRRGFYVLRNNRIPAVLVECGFLTNPTEARRAQSSRYRQIMAERIAVGIDDYNGWLARRR
ncbi:MAG: N-acetylmuramoyl-L-alanine amidase [Verrucomicrobiales bacterium]